MANSAKKARSGPTLSEARRAELGQVRINLRLEPEPAAALKKIAKPGERPTATISRLLLAIGKHRALQELVDLLMK